MRVVSLDPAATEICYALGVRPVGVSAACDFPPAVARTPTVSEARLGDAVESGDSAAIDDAVTAASEDGGVYAIDADRLEALAPDLIIAQGVCDVCAVDGSRVLETLADLPIDPAVHTIDVHSLGDLRAAIETIGAATGRREAATALCDRLATRIQRVAARTPGDQTLGSFGSADATADASRDGTSPADSLPADAPSVVVLDWMDPVMVAGHWVPELVGLAGGRYPLATTGDPSRPREWAAVRRADPDVLVVAPCGFDVERTRSNLDELRSRPGWAALRAVRTDAVRIVDGSALMNRPGPRLVETLAVLADVIRDGYRPEQSDGSRAGWSDGSRSVRGEWVGVPPGGAPSEQAGDAE